MMWASFYKAGSSHGCVMFRIPANIQSMALNIRGFMRVRGFSMDLTLTPPRCFFIASSAIWRMILWKLWFCLLADWWARWVEALNRSLFSSFCCRETCIHVLNALHCTHTSARMVVSLFVLPFFLEICRCLIEFVHC